MMLDTALGLERFAWYARRHADLTVQNLALASDPAFVRVRNRFSATLAETVTCSDEGAFVTSWGYRLGSTDDVESAAARLAFLLAALPA
jgi:DNA/RNA-binding domain of Phe-tRNA-synthetase-like protein